MKRAIIIGAGPAGLTTAIALRAAGFEAAVFERAEAVREVGSGLTIWPNAMKALDHIGAAEAVRAVCRPLDGIAIRSWRGETLSATPGAVMERYCGGPSAALHRSEFIAVLLKLVSADVVTLAARCTGFRSDESGVTALFADGREERADLLIGADGIRSVVAAQLFGATKLRYAGYPVWRGISDFELPSGAGMTTMGPGAQFGLFPMTNHRVYWFATFSAPEGHASRGEHARVLLEHFGGWHAPIKAVIQATDESAIIATDIYDRKPLHHWGRGRVTLVGDAAHPSTPNLGQGACQAIEDAVVLGACLSTHDDLPTALRAYEARRAPRANAMTIQARRMGQMGQWRFQPICWLRERMIKRTPAPVNLRFLQWLCNFEV